MIKNRYDDILREYNQDIINLSPANQTMRIELALEIKRILERNPDTEVLEIGVGEGDLTKYILQYNPDIKLDCLDISPEMIDSAKKNLGNQNINFIQADASEYLDNPETKAYGIIVSAWTMHNFTRKDQMRFFINIHDKLVHAGVMLIMDKIYTDNPQKNIELLLLQKARYDNYLSEDISIAITAHEVQDFEDQYKMQESKTKLILQEIGFRGIEVLDRIERDVLLIARK